MVTQVHKDDEQTTAVMHRTADYQPPRSWRTWLIGRPLQTADAPHQTIGKIVGLAVFASDALSSTAYATQEILVILAAAGTAAFGFVFPISIAIAILLHNIPEGIATALPLCQSGVCRWDSFRAAFFSGLSEPFGALLAALFLSTFHQLIPGALAFAGGVMVFITLDELIPTARAYGHQHYTAMGIIMGAIFVFILSGLFGV